MSQSVTKWQYRFGLIGERLDYSFSPPYFSNLFGRLGLDQTHTYEAWPLPDEAAVRLFLEKRAFSGCNVTIPYKQVVAKACDVLVGYAAISGAVNTIHHVNGILIGYNTDVYGIIQSLDVKSNIISDLDASNLMAGKNILILGSGGASRAAQAAASFLGCSYSVVSRSPGVGSETYDSIKRHHHLSQFDIIINTTPLGMSSLIDKMPDLNYDQINEKHLVFDVIYNPKKTLLLERAEEAGANTVNGELMLQEQANLAWKIWNH